MMHICRLLRQAKEGSLLKSEAGLAFKNKQESIFAGNCQASLKMEDGSWATNASVMLVVRAPHDYNKVTRIAP